ncbi:MAG TPA: gluconate 2-dehydrogenase subunit 3 family protein [Kiritimatiellia bacterium]|nr:gluconate 2-dehydrogenase subunit 3 family protein [Kiritimatiellia bacterium]HMO99976.1 gluconate 2-dehydrogenase subunit 3 family protein [Kiritimatiellia bacterium]
MKQAITRRAFLYRFGLGVTGYGVFNPIGRPAFAEQNRDMTYARLDALVDTFIPRDEEPGGVDAGISHLLASMAETNPSLKHYLSALLDRLDEESNRRHGQMFSEQPLDERERLLNHVFVSQDEDLRDARTGIQLIRDDIFTAFYLSEAGMGLLDYHPPFPLGYLDYAAPVVEAP